MIPILIIAMVSVVIVLLVYAQTHHRLRAKSLRKKAKAWGMSFSEDSPFIDLKATKNNTSLLTLGGRPLNHLSDLIETWLKYPSIATYKGRAPLQCFPFMQRENLVIENVMWGTENSVPIRIFDMKFASTGRDDDSERFTCVLANMNGNWPATQLSHRTDLSKLREEDSMTDVEMLSTEFHEMFHVRSVDPAFASKLLNGRIRELLMSSSKSISELYFHETWMLGVRPRVTKASGWKDWRTFVYEFAENTEEFIKTSYPTEAPLPIVVTEPALVI